MDIENTKDLRTWIEKGEVSDDIEIIIKAFSDYITAVDSEYQYNKTFLKDFIPAFIVKRALGIEILQQLKGASKFVLQTPTFSVVSDGSFVFMYQDKRTVPVSSHIKTKEPSPCLP